MKIKSIESSSTEFVGFVRVTTETGAQGWGQVAMGRMPEDAPEDFAGAFGLHDPLRRMDEEVRSAQSKRIGEVI